MQQKIYKVIAALLAVTIMYASLLPVISYAADSLLTAQELESQETSTNNKNVEFDVYYDDDRHSRSIDIDSTDTKLNISLNVKEAGYLKDISVDFADANFLIADDNENADAIKNFDSANKRIEFNQINSGNNVVKSINISADKQDQVDENMLSKDNSITFNGIYVNENGEEEKVSKTIVIHTGWKTDAGKAVVSYETIKYIPFVSNKGNKLIIQGKINSGLETNILPIKSTQISLTAPQIENEYPESVTVIANNTSATNGDETGLNFTQDNWTYDNQTGKIEINVNNNPNNGKISWKKNVLDEYIVTYIYSEDVYEEIKNTSVKLDFEVTVEISLYNDGTGTTVISNGIGEYSYKQKKLGELIDITTHATDSINKGYMYNNKETAEENKRETDYMVSYTANVSYADIIDKISIEQQIDTFTTETSENLTTISGTNYTYNKQLRVLESEFKKVLGENGSISILNGETVLATITKDTPVTDGYYIVDLTNYNVNNIRIETSKPEKEGSLSIDIFKSIAKDIDYSKNQINNFTNIKTSVIGRAYNEDIAISEISGESLIKLEEPTQKASITSNKESLSTIIENTDVEIKATLENDSIDDAMYENPTVRINLPSNIEKINIKEAKLYFDDELQIVESNLVDNEDGTKSIVTTLSGKQTKYNNVAAKGATLSFIADITLNKLTPTTQTQIGLVVDNGDEAQTQTTASYNISYIAPTGVVTTNSIANYKPDADPIMSISGEEKEALIPTLAGAQNPIFTMNVINNYSNDLSNIVVLGRTPFAGNKNPETQEDLGSSITLPLTSGLTVSGIDANYTVYYSENGEATRDLTSTANGWTTEVSDYSKIKSYMIVFNNYTMQQGANFTLQYTANIPENLQYNMSAYGTYVVYFNNLIRETAIEDKAIATKVGVTTGSGPVIDAKLESLMSGDSISSGNVLKYKLTVNNTGSEKAVGLKARIPVDDSISYVEEDETRINGYTNSESVTYEDGEEGKIIVIDIGDVDVQSSISKEIWLLTTASATEDKTFNIKATISNDKVSAETESLTVKVLKTFFETQISSNEDAIDVGDTFRLRMLVKSSEEDLGLGDIIPDYQYKGERTNSVITFELPEELSIDNVTIDDEDKTSQVTTNNNMVSINLGTVGSNTMTIVVTFRGNNLGDEIYERSVTITPQIKADGMDNAEIMDSINVTVNKPGLSITQTSNIPSIATIETAQRYTYTFTIKNLSNSQIHNITFEDKLPTELTYSGLDISVDNGSVSKLVDVSDDGTVSTNIAILEGKATATINLYVVANRTENDITISNKGVISQLDIGTIESNTLTNTIKKYTPSDIVVPPTEEPRQLTGNIWIDTNNDGIKDDEEPKSIDVEVLLLDNTSGNIAQDLNGNDLITKTDSNGDYAFSHVRQGRYTVIFFYDSANFSPTIYQKEGADQTRNSDALDKDVVYEGETRKAAVTEEILLTDVDMYNIDLGLIEDKKFDLRLDKIVKNLTVNNNSGTKTTQYNNDLARIDIEAKDADSSTMVVEYTLRITNEGAVPGYAKRIADYIPDGLSFNSGLNTEWYEGADGVIYNTSLANTLINPGETKELTLILTTKITDNSFGMITNNAEIMEMSNDYGLQDIDSVAGNNSTNEDDYSTANIILGVKTGQVFIYVTLAFTLIAIIGVGTYIIKKKVLK